MIDWQIDVNITHLNNTKAYLHNGTHWLLDLSQNETQVDFNGQRNFTYNATWQGIPNNIWLTLVSSETSGRNWNTASFLVEVGIREFNKTYYEESDVELPDNTLIVPPDNRMIAYKEAVVLQALVLIGLGIICKAKCCPNTCQIMQKTKP